ncbi:hypothetical protein [Microcoleus sp.]|uniref:hypothetical protein n=1 Tax=Microcoleus sp. TaxID=44472 RepID=UPI003593A2C6
MSNNVDRTFIVFLIVSYLEQAPIDPVSGIIFGCGSTAPTREPAINSRVQRHLLACHLFSR